jgi:hypothetical protein
VVLPLGCQGFSSLDKFDSAVRHWRCKLTQVRRTTCPGVNFIQKTLSMTTYISSDYGFLASQVDKLANEEYKCKSCNPIPKSRMKSKSARAANPFQSLRSCQALNLAGPLNFIHSDHIACRKILVVPTRWTLILKLARSHRLHELFSEKEPTSQRRHSTEEGRHVVEHAQV